VRKVLATSKHGRTLVAFGWVDVRVCDGAGVRAAEPVSLDLRRAIREDPDLMDFIDLNYYGPPSKPATPPRKQITVRAKSPNYEPPSISGYDITVEYPDKVKESEEARAERENAERGGW
jgi:hypothetical protein